MKIWKTCALAAAIVVAGSGYGRCQHRDIPAGPGDAAADNAAQGNDSAAPEKSDGDIPAVKAAQQAAKAAPQETAGVPVKGIGSYFNGGQPGKQAPLFIYYRGWLSESNYPGGGLYGGKITGEANILRSSRAAFTHYELMRLASEKGLVVLATGSSDIAVKQADIENLQRELGYDFPRVYVAAHSGGYVGLSASIDSLKRVDGIILLDPFYSDFSAKILPRTQSGTSCTGYFTPHNKARYQKWFSGLKCSFDESTTDKNHDPWVVPSLEKNLPDMN